MPTLTEQGTVRILSDRFVDGCTLLLRGSGCSHRKRRQRIEDRRSAPLLGPACACGDCTLAHASGVVAFFDEAVGPRCACARRRIDGAVPPKRLPSASRITVHVAILCVPGKVVSIVLYAPPPHPDAHSVFCRCRSTSCTQGCHLLRAVCIGRKGICLHFSLWQQARIGIQPDVASGRYAQLRLCPTRLRSGHHKIMRSNAKATSDLHSKAGRQIQCRDNYTTQRPVGFCCEYNQGGALTRRSTRLHASTCLRERKACDAPGAWLLAPPFSSMDMKRGNAYKPIGRELGCQG